MPATTRNAQKLSLTSGDRHRFHSSLGVANKVNWVKLCKIRAEARFETLLPIMLCGDRSNGFYRNTEIKIQWCL
jgi:hypothetical protein